MLASQRGRSKTPSPSWPNRGIPWRRQPRSARVDNVKKQGCKFGSQRHASVPVQHAPTSKVAAPSRQARARGSFARPELAGPGRVPSALHGGSQRYITFWTLHAWASLGCLARRADALDPTGHGKRCTGPRGCAKHEGRSRYPMATKFSFVKPGPADFVAKKKGMRKSVP